MLFYTEERRLPFHSKFELIKTESILEEPRTNVIKQVQIMRFLDFMKTYKNPKEAFPHLADVRVSDENLDDFEVFFFRQRFNDVDSSYIPELKPICVCRQIINPDEDNALCPNPLCGEYMHLNCLRHNADRKCYECKTEFPIKDLYSLKRTLEQANSGDSAQIQDEEEDLVEPHNKRRKLDSLEKVPEKRTVYLSIKSDESAYKLDELINHLKAKHDSTVMGNSNLNSIQKTRKNAKEMFSHSLLLGVFEAREQGMMERIENAMKGD